MARIGLEKSSELPSEDRNWIWTELTESTRWVDSVTSTTDSLLTGLYPGRASIGSDLLTSLEHLNMKSDRVGFNTIPLEPNKTWLNPSLPSAWNLGVQLRASGGTRKMMARGGELRWHYGELRRQWHRQSARSNGEATRDGDDDAATIFSDLRRRRSIRLDLVVVVGF